MQEEYGGVLSALTKRGFIAHYAADKEQALSIADSLIPKGAAIGFGGSRTVTDLGVPSFFCAKGCDVRHASVQTAPSFNQSSAAAGADWFIASANALTQDGEIINVDGRANRVANMAYGIPCVLLFVGKNKLVADLADGFRRVREVAAPRNCVRFGKDNPCVHGVFDKCAECADTICRATLILHHPTYGTVFHVIIVDEDYGF